VRLRYLADAIELEVTDDGRGQVVQSHGANSSGHGLIGMRERVALYGGTVSTGNRQGAGFAVRVTFPWGVRADDPSAHC
jgi:signal transduction histidine kinase